MIKLGILGYGTVGKGLVELINKNKDKNKEIHDIEIECILVRTIKKYVKEEYYPIITEDIEDFFSKEIDIVVEVMGGVDNAYSYVKRALELKKHVITANKDLIAEYGEELLNIAKTKGVSLRFEASVGGGIPVIKPLMDCLYGNDILSITAILNGTTNFILTKMDSEGMKYENALKLAQELGFAESNPSADVNGYDAARKLAILSTIAYDKRINWKHIKTEGIVNLDPIDFYYANKNNCCIKLIAMSRDEKNKVSAVVKPMLVSKNSNLSKIDNEFNAINIEGDAVGHIAFSGKGAGKLPTASSVYNDLVDIIKDKVNYFQFSNREIEVTDDLKTQGRYMIRINSTKEELGVKSLYEEFGKDKIRNLDLKEGNILGIIDIDENINVDKKISRMEKLSHITHIKKIRVLD